jgi:hypothetical protein
MMSVSFFTTCGPVGRPRAAEIDQSQSARLGCDDYVRRLNIAMRDLQPSMELANGIR